MEPSPPLRRVYRAVVQICRPTRRGAALLRRAGERKVRARVPLRFTSAPSVRLSDQSVKKVLTNYACPSGAAVVSLRRRILPSVSQIQAVETARLRS